MFSIIILPNAKKQLLRLDKKIIEDFFERLGIGFEEVDKIGLNKENTKTKNSNFSMNLLKIHNTLPKKIEVKDFVRNFKNRFKFIKKILQEHSELDNLISINRIEESKQMSIIGMVYSKRLTKNGNVLIELEDLSGKVSAIINKDKEELFEKSNELLLDEVIGVKCSGSKEIVFVNEIIFPDAKIHEKKTSKYEESVAFISDLHVGSKKFLEKNFLKFIDWINGNIGNDNQKKEALQIKYLFITGDSIDGVGIFPGQEKELAIQDVKEQYKKLADLLSKIRSDIQMVICPGQHDAVRVAEPQPIIPETYAEPLYYLKNINFTTNPSLVGVGKGFKLKVLMYHGASMHGIINSINKLRLGSGHDSPTSVVKYMLMKRHLAPTHSLVTYTLVEDEDALLIKEIPDVIATGDLHRPEIASYNGILLVASSCWQSRTPFEEKVGNNPDPCKVPVLNLKTREIKIWDFSSGLDKYGNEIKGEKDEN
ncbi:MAG: metallophosphoesterase [Nanoarchaeota archaeon]|nr:metallophosphoesterase [Nanoarchaeota archaeon]